MHFFILAEADLTGKNNSIPTTPWEIKYYYDNSTRKDPSNSR